jgi:hypothetical protein
VVKNNMRMKGDNMTMKLFKKVSIIPEYFLFIISLSIVLLLSSSAVASENEYYYLQVASFRAEDRANNYAETLRIAGQNPVIYGEHIGDLGYWYRVYLGPYSTGKEAKLKEIEIKDKGLIDLAIIRKKNSLDPEKAMYAGEVVQGSGTRANEVIVTDAGLSLNEGRIQYTKGPVTEDIIIASSMVSEEKEGPGTDDRYMAGKDATSGTQKDMEKRGKGRNINKNTWGLGIKHISLKVKTDLTKRQLLTSNGTTATLTEFPITTEIENGFPTSGHIDHLNIRYGLSESFEVFGGIGAAYYDNLSEAEPSYGVGLRLNLFQTGYDRFYGFYGAVQGEYIVGEVEEEYKAASGERWGKDADFKSFDGKIEFGIARSNLNIYGGGSFLTYRENAERRLLDNLPAGLVSAMYRDDLKGKNILGVFGGISYYLTPSVLLNLEGQNGNQNSGSAAIEYHV